MSTLTRAQHERLVEALTHSLVWEYAGHDVQVQKRAIAVRLADEMERMANVGNAIQIRRAIEKTVDREDVA